MGGIAYKFVSPNMVGVPDRLILLPGCRLLFIETKAPKKGANSKQLRRHKELRERGAAVFVADTIELVDQILQPYRGH